MKLETAKGVKDIKPEEKIILKLLVEPMERDELIRKMKKPTGEATAILSVMEIKGLIREELGEIRASF